MLTLAQLIKLVLDEAYSEISLPPAKKDKAIKKGIDDLTASYGQLTSKTRTAIDYSNPILRFAYIYKYTVAHSDYVRQLLANHSPLQQLFKAPDVSVACLGGGPGSDLLGILKYMLRGGCRSTLTCYLFDRERAWGDSWSEVAKPLKASFPLYPVFQQLDVTKPDTWKDYRKFLKADLFTLSYFLSEVWTFKEKSQPFFEHCFSGAKSGAIILYIDNNDMNGRFSKWFDSLAASNDVEQLCGNTCKMVFALEEEKKDMEPYYSKFGWPKRESNVCFRIGRKR